MYKFAFCILAIVAGQPKLYAQNKQLDRLVYTKQFTKADSLFKVTMLSRPEKMIYRALLMNAFYQPESSNNLIKKVLSGQISRNGKAVQYHLYRALYDNYVQLYNYRKAYQASLILSSKFRSLMDSADVEGLQEETKIYHALQDVKPQSLFKSSTSFIPITHDLAGLINIPLQTGGASGSFIFDTGANISTITETYAQKLHLKILPRATVNVAGSFNGISTLAHLGIAKELKIGQVSVRNVVFLVYPDSTLTFAGGAYKINGIIGFPVIRALEEFILTKDTLTIPAITERAQGRHNLASDGLTPLIYLNYSGICLPFTFDSGAQSSLFNFNFYNRFKDMIDKDAKSDSLRLGGAGGSKDIKTLTAAKVCLNVGSSINCFPSAQISLDTITGNDKFYYGNIGLDLVRQFREVRFNFPRAIVSIRK